MSSELYSVLPMLISIAALGVSATTLWLTHLRLGTVQITQPSQIYLGPDGAPPYPPRIFIRVLLYATSTRGRCVENLFVRLRRGESAQNFFIWVHGETGKLVRSAGLLVGPNGVDRTHHFIMSADSNFKFQSGEYTFELFMKIVGDKHPKKIFAQEISISEHDASLMNTPLKGLFLDWGPDSQSYIKTVRPTDQNITIPALEEEREQT